MTISFYPYVMRGDRWDFPLADAGGDYPNFANGNAADLLDELGFGREGIWDAEPVAIDLFEQAVVLARMGMDGKLSPARESRVSQAGDGKITIIECGTWEGRVNERIEALVKLVQFGRAVGATHIGWG